MSQDAIHYFAAILGYRVCGDESTFGDCRTLHERFETYKTVRDKLLSMLEANEELAYALETEGDKATLIEHTPDVLDGMAHENELKNEAHLKRQARKWHRIFVEWCAFLRINPWSAEDLIDNSQH